MKLIVGLLIALLLVAASFASPAKPRVCSLDADLLQRSKVRATDSQRAALRRAAERAMKAGPYTVTQKVRTPPSGDKHDYLSLAPYWWPNPKSKDGLPYLRRDGELFPDAKRGTDANTIGAMAETVETLAVAYYFTGQARYAERAALLIHAWFLDPDTRMNPHLRYAQAILGRNEGRGAGLIESRHFIKVVDAVGLLDGAAAWTGQDQAGLTAWFREFVAWMQTSAHGRDEAKARNNHGSWYAAQLACFARFTGDEELARKTVEATKARIAWQIEPDGRQPEELTRTRGLWYSGFNLEALFILAEVGKQMGVDLYGFATKDGRSLRRAVDYLTPYADPARAWPHQQINELAIARQELAYVLRRAALAYREPKYEALLAKHLATELDSARWSLLWPDK